MKPQVLAIVILVVVSSIGYANPVRIDAGASVTFNFDLAASGAVPPPPYTGLDIVHSGRNFENFTTGTIRLYSGLNGTGELVLTQDYGFFPFGISIGSANMDPFSDGVFSIIYSVDSGSVTVEPYAVAMTGRVGLDAQNTDQISPLAGATYGDVASVPDVNGDGSPDTAGLTGRRVTILDSVTGEWITHLNFFEPGWTVKAIASLDSNTDGMPDLAALGQSREDGRIVVLIRDIRTRNRVGRMRFFAYQKMTPISMTVGDVDLNGSPDIGVMAVRDDGRVAVEYRDADTGEQLPDWVRDRIWFPPY